MLQYRKREWLMGKEGDASGSGFELSKGEILRGRAAVGISEGKFLKGTRMGGK